jgi:AraC-like DNA-binding protein
MLDARLVPQIDPELLLGSDPLPPLAGPVRLSLNDRPMRERHSVLRECFARIGYRYDVTPVADMPFVADLVFNQLPGILVAEGTLHGSRNQRTRPIIDDAIDEAVLLINLCGPHLIEQFGEEIELGDGEAVLISGTDPSCFTHKPPGHLLGLRVPKSRLTPMLAHKDRSYLRRIPAANATLALLRNYVSLTWDEGVTANAAVQRLMSDHVFDLLALLLGPNGEAAEMAWSNGRHAAKLNAVKQDIGRHLDRPELNVATLAGRHGLTPRALQRLFEADGTSFTRYVLRKRLAHAYEMLASKTPDREKICSVAYSCGFNDVSYFNRAFRRQYGAAPSDIRNRPA